MQLRFAVIFAGAMLAAGCAAPRQNLEIEPAQLVKAKNAERDPLATGIYFDETDRSIYIKCKDAPAITVIDNYFNKRRLNYSISAHSLNLFSDNANLTICDGCENGAADFAGKKQMKFETLEAFFQYLTDKLSKIPPGSASKTGCYPLVCRDDVLDKDAFVGKVLKGDDPVSVSIREDIRFSNAQADQGAAKSDDERVLQTILEILNDKIRNTNLYLDYRRRLTAYKIELPNSLREQLKADADLNFLPPGETVDTRISAVNRYLIDQVYLNELKRSSRIGYRFTGDGVDFYDVNSLYKDPSARIFKKIFINSVIASDVQSRLNELFPLDPQSSNKIVTLPQQNALVVMAKEDTVQQINRVIWAIDTKYDSVMVETKVFEYIDAISNQIGAAVEYSATNRGGETYGFNFFDKGLDTLVMPTFRFVAEKTKDEIKERILSNLALHASKDVVRITAEPRLVLEPGAAASVELMTTKYILTNPAVAASGAMEKIPTGIKFTLTPTILTDKRILLTVELEQSEFIVTDDKRIVQATSNNRIKTSVIANNGELFSIGGIKAKRTSKRRSGIPWLKDLPGAFGYLFGAEEIVNTDVTIEFMIRPTIKFSDEASRGILRGVLEKDEQVLQVLEHDPDDFSKDIKAAVEAGRKK